MEKIAENEATATEAGWVRVESTGPATSGTGTTGTQTMNENTQENTVHENTMHENTMHSEQAEASTPRKQMLYRHPQDRLVGGVCGGLGDLMGWDANLVRILWVVVTLATSGGGILAYLALWALLPVGTAAHGQVRPPALALNERNLGRAAVVLIGLGLVWLLANVGVLPWMWGAFWRVTSIIFWPALLIGAGYLLLRYTGRGEWTTNWNWRGTKDRVQSEVNGRMPTKQSMQERYEAARARFPLKRSRTDRIFMGVCGGIGKRVGIDANLVRLVWAAFSVGSIGMGVLLYVAMGLFLPEEFVTDVQPYDDEGQDVQVIDVRSSNV